MASVKKSVLMEYLRCTLCMEDMERSCILQCHHSFCVDCLQKYMKTATDPQKMTCPICRKVTTLPGGDLTNLPPNFFVDNLKELITKETDGDEDEMTLTASADKEVAICSLEDCQGGAVMYCTVCQEYLCQTCTDEHAGHRLTRKHQAIPAAEAKDRMTSSTQSHHPCGRHPNQMLDTYCKTCEEIICHECFNTEHNDHNFTTLRPFVKPCEERLNILLKRIDKLLKCVDLARQTSLQQLDKAQHHIVSLKTQVTTTFTQIREKLTHQEERLMSDLNRAETRVNKVASSIQDEQQLAEVNLKSQCYLGQSLLRGDVYDQISNLPSLEEAVEKRWTTEIPGVVWIDTSDKNEMEMSLLDVNHLTLTENSHTASVLPRLKEDTGSDRVSHSEEGACSMVGDSSEMDDRLPLESGEINRFNSGRHVTGICVYNKSIFMLKWDAALYMYSDGGKLMKTHVVDGMRESWDVTVMTQDDSDKLIISSRSPKCLFYIPVQSTGDTCTLGTTHSKKLDYEPWGLCVNHNNNLVVTDRNNKSLHVYSSSEDEINTIKLPSGINLRFVSSTPSGGYVVTGCPKQIIWIDGQGVQQRHHKDTACGVALSILRGVVRDSENRYLVADCDNNQLLLFSKDGGDVRCLLKDQITSPSSLYLDQQQHKLYVGTWDGQDVVVYDYYMLLGEKYPIKYTITRMCIKSA